MWREIGVGFNKMYLWEVCLLICMLNVGSMEDAQEVFDKMLERDAVTWTSIMAGYVQIEHLREAHLGEALQ